MLGMQANPPFLSFRSRLDFPVSHAEVEVSESREGYGSESLHQIAQWQPQSARDPQQLQHRWIVGAPLQPADDVGVNARSPRQGGLAKAQQFTPCADSAAKN